MKYIAQPYSDPSAEVRAERAYKGGAFAAACVKHGYIVYSPIASWHHLAVEHKLPGDFQFWRRLNLQILRYADEFWILQLEGWDKSIGLAGELELVRKLAIPVKHFDGDTFLRQLT